MSMLKKPVKNLAPPKVLISLVCILSALCTAAYVGDVFVLKSIWSRLLVFGGILVVWGILLYIACRLFKSSPPLRVVLLSVAAAVLLLFVCRNALFPPQQEVYVSLIGESGICLCDLVVDGENIPFSHAEVVENSGWLYQDTYDNFVIQPEKDGAKNRLTMRLFAGDVHIGFWYSPDTGNVTIESSVGSGGGTWDLSYTKETGEVEMKYADFPIDCHRVYSPQERLYGAGFLPLLSFLCLILLPEFSKRLSLQIGLSAIYCLLFFTSIKNGPDTVTVGFLLLLTVGSCLCLSSDLARRYLEKYRTRRKTVLIAAIALYASLASFGQRFFMDGNVRIHISAEGLFYVALGMIWFVPVLYMLLLGLECLAAFPRKPRTEPVRRRRAFWALLAILCLCQAVVVWSFWPGGFPADAISQLMQALGVWSITDWHPAINSILYRIILNIYPHAGALITVQLFFFALLCTKFLMLGYDYGVHFKTLAILGAVFSLLPNWVLFGVSPLKDYSYTLSLLWGTYLLARLSLNPEELRSPRFCAALSLALFLIYAFRHNGVVPFIMVLLAFAWITLRRFSRVKLRLAVVSLASVLLIAVYKGPIYSLYHVVEDTGMSPYSTMLCAVASCINKDLPLSEESTAIMESLLPLDQWADYYRRYQGHDLYYWDRGELVNEYPFEPTKLTAREAFTVYLEALRKYPDVVIKDRLDGMDILWDVRQPTDSFNSKGFCDVSLNEAERELISDYFDFGPMTAGVSFCNHSWLLKTYRETMFTAENSVFDILLWRTGAYLILMMVLGVFWWTNRMKSLLLATVPFLGQIAGLALVLYHQSYRYVAAVQILTLMLAFCSIFLRNAEAGGWLILPAEEPPAEKPDETPVVKAEEASVEKPEETSAEKADELSTEKVEEPPIPVSRSTQTSRLKSA